MNLKISLKWLYLSCLALLIINTILASVFFNKKSQIVVCRVGFYSICIVNVVIEIRFYLKKDKINAYKFFNNILFLVLTYGLFLNLIGCELMN